MAALSLEDVRHLSDEIRHLVRAGMPLEATLAEAGQGRGARLEALTLSISNELGQGRSLQEIVDKQAIGTPRMLASAVGAGIQSGDLGLTVEIMGDFASDVIELRSKLFQAAVYPLTIVAVASVLVVLVIQHALEIFLDTIFQWDIKTYPLLITLLEWNRDMPWWTLLLPLAGLVLLAFWTLTGRASAMAFRGPERLLLLLPGVGGLVRDLQNYTMSRMISLLTERGLPLHESLLLAGGASGSRGLQLASRETAGRMKQGYSVSTDNVAGTVTKYPLPSLLRVCLKQVERDESRMVHRLRSVAEFYKNRMERNSVWVKLMMPVMMFIVIGGGCVLMYAVMVFWPVSEMYKNIGQ